MIHNTAKISQRELNERAALPVIRNHETYEQYCIRYEHWPTGTGFWDELPIPAPQMLPYAAYVPTEAPQFTEYYVPATAREEAHR